MDNLTTTCGIWWKLLNLIWTKSFTSLKWLISVKVEQLRSKELCQQRPTKFANANKTFLNQSVYGWMNLLFVGISYTDSQLRENKNGFDFRQLSTGCWVQPKPVGQVAIKLKNSEGHDRIPQRIIVDGIGSEIGPLSVLFNNIYINEVWTFKLTWTCWTQVLILSK